MYLYRMHGGRWRKFDISGLHSGRTAFLVGGSPSLLLQPHGGLSGSSRLVVALNNAAAVVRAGCSLFCDKPPCYRMSCLMDRGSGKVAKRVHAMEEVLPGLRWADVPNTYFFDQEEGGPADLPDSDALVSGNDGLSAGLSLLFRFGVSRIVLCGMSLDSGGHSDGSSFGPDEESWNAALYLEQRDSLARHAEALMKAGVAVVDTSVDSKLAGIVPTIPLSEALEEFRDPPPAPMPEWSERPVAHCTALYPRDELASRFESARRTVESARPDSTPVVMGFSYVGASQYYRHVNFLMLLASVHSLARTNPGRPLYMVFGDTVPDDDRELVFRLASGMELHPCSLGRGVPSQCERGPVTNLRCFMWERMPFLKEAIWLDSDVVVRRRLDMLAIEARRACARTGLTMAGARDFGTDWSIGTGPSYVNAGVMYFDLEAQRSSGKGKELSDLCARLSDPGRYHRDNYSDQDAVNFIGVAPIDPTWNFQAYTRLVSGCAPKALNDEELRTAGILHYVCNKHLVLKLPPEAQAPLARSINMALDALGRRVDGGRTATRLLHFEYDREWMDMLRKNREEMENGQ